MTRSVILFVLMPSMATTSKRQGSSGGRSRPGNRGPSRRSGAASNATRLRPRRRTAPIRRAFTSTKTSVGPSSATMSISPKRVRNRVARIAYPRSVSASQASNSPCFPSVWRFEAFRHELAQEARDMPGALGNGAVHWPDFKRCSLRTSALSRRTSSALHAVLPAPFTPNFPCPSRRTSRALHPELPAPFTPNFPRPSPRTSRALHPELPAPFTPNFPRPSPRTSRALHPELPAPFTPNFPRPSPRTSRALHSEPHVPLIRVPFAPLPPERSFRTSSSISRAASVSKDLLPIA